MKDKIIVITSDNRKIFLNKKFKELRYYELSFFINSNYCYKRKIDFKSYHCTIQCIWRCFY